MGQKTSKHQPNAAHRAKKRQKNKHTFQFQDNINTDINNGNDNQNDNKCVFDEQKRGINTTTQEQNIQR